MVMVNDTQTLSLEKYFKKIFPADCHLRFAFVTNSVAEESSVRSKSSSKSKRTQSQGKLNPTSVSHQSAA